MRQESRAWTGRLGRRFRFGLMAAGALLGVGLVVRFALAAGVLDPPVPGFSDVLHFSLLGAAAGLLFLRGLAVRDERGGWLLLAVAVLSWSAGDLVFTLAFVDRDPLPFPTVSDALWLGFLPASYAGLLVLLRSRVRAVRGSLWIDGVVAALLVGAIGSAVLLDAVIMGTGGTVATVAVNLAYPLGDAVLIALVVTTLSLTGWRPDTSWALILGGLAATALADLLFLWQTATGSYVHGAVLDAVWPAGMLALAAAAWQPRRGGPEARHEGRLLEAVEVEQDEPPGPRRVGGQLRLEVRQQAAAVAEAGEGVREGVTPALGEQREVVAEGHRGPHEDAGERSNRQHDGDGIHRREARIAEGNLADAVRPWRGAAYRIGGDEFCALIDWEPTAHGDRVAAVADALAERGGAFDIRASHGAVALGTEADDPEAVLQLADTRMYANKESTGFGLAREARAVLLEALGAREPALRDHVDGVAELCRAVGARMGMDAEGLDELVRAAELHDIGKLAIPDTILCKPGPLDAAEWEFMRRHTVIGEAILAAAPALRPVGRLVRSTHERWDGSGYPDGRKGVEIPLGARIVFVCDTFNAMTSNRCCRAALTPEQALAELSRCAGTQFDPAVVRVFRGVVAEHTATPVSIALA